MRHVILKQINWEASGDHYFYENHHLEPRPVKETGPGEAAEYWIYYNSSKFSGKKLVIPPGGSFESVDRGVYNVLVWRGQGSFDGMDVRGGDHRLDELLVTHARATTPLTIRNTGSENLVMFKFFGPDINTDIAPRIEGRTH